MSARLSPLAVVALVVAAFALSVTVASLTRPTPHAADPASRTDAAERAGARVTLGETSRLPGLAVTARPSRKKTGAAARTARRSRPSGVPAATRAPAAAAAPATPVRATTPAATAAPPAPAPPPARAPMAPAPRAPAPPAASTPVAPAPHAAPPEPSGTFDDKGSGEFDSSATP